MAEKARMRPRHWGLIFAFFLFVLVPLGGTGWYLSDRAVDQYASTTGFSVRREDRAAPADVLGGLTSLAFSSSSSGETDILYEFIQSQDLIARIDARIDLRAHFSLASGYDPVFSLRPNSSTEDLRDFWRRMVRLSYDRGAGLMSLQVRAFSPEMARQIAQEILAESQLLVNELNATARKDALKYAEEDLNEALLRLKEAREALVRFRTRTQIVDPASDLQGRIGVLNSLQQQLAQALIDYDLLIQTTSQRDARVQRASRQIEVVRDRIAEERRTFAEDGRETGLAAYPALLAEYESLTVDLEFAEESYRAALTALDAAIANAARNSLYLATFIQPTLAQDAEYPRRWIIFGLAALSLVLIWSILSLVFYSLRDRR